MQATLVERDDNQNEDGIPKRPKYEHRQDDQIDRNSTVTNQRFLVTERTNQSVLQFSDNEYIEKDFIDI